MVLSGFTGFDVVLLSFTGFLLVTALFFSILPGFNLLF